MPKRYITRYKYPKQAWNPVFAEFQQEMTIPPLGESGVVVVTVPLATNSVSQGTSAPTSTILQVSRFKVKLDILYQNNYASSLSAFVFYIPQGVDIPTNSTTIFQQHPEWIMAWNKYSIDSSSTLTLNTGRLKRNLKSGDKVVLCLSSYNNTQSTMRISVNCSSYFCCRSHS